MTSRPARLARGAVTGAFATLVAAVLHISAGGIAPSPLAMGLALVFATLLGTAATGRRPSLPRVAVAVSLTQAAFHLGFSYLGTDAAVASAATAHHGAPSVAPALVASGSPTAHAAHSDDPVMWLAHAAAAVLTIVFLFRAERALWSLLEATARTIRAAFGATSAVLPFHAPALGAPGFTERPVLAGRLATPLSRRGPPLLLGA